MKNIEDAPICIREKNTSTGNLCFQYGCSLCIFQWHFVGFLIARVIARFECLTMINQEFYLSFCWFCAQCLFPLGDVQDLTWFVKRNKWNLASGCDVCSGRVWPGNEPGATGSLLDWACLGRTLGPIVPSNPFGEPSVGANWLGRWIGD